MDNFDLIFPVNPVQSSMPSAEIDSLDRCDLDLPIPFGLLDTIDDYMPFIADQSFEDILDSLRSVEGLDANSGFDDLWENEDKFGSTESNDMAKLIQSSDEHLAMIKPNSAVLSVTRPPAEKSSTKVALGQSIILSESVAITVPKPNQLQISHSLEEVYKARYKSDYFPQNGIVRRPRYVADDKGNHFVTLKMPSEYRGDLAHQYVRIALITTFIDNQQHYYSPYKFQTNHNDAKVPDQNPTYVPVNLPKGSDSMKLQLVLIKSKLDQLYDAQPLKPFADTLGTIQNIISDEKLASKDLICKYQLDKSHLAFTLCTKLPDGSYAVHPETTVISSVVSESSAKRATTSKSNPSAASKSPVKKISCPNCKHCFDPSEAPAVEQVVKRKAPTRTSSPTGKAATIDRTTKKKKAA